VRIATVVGARPQFVKAAPVSHALRARHTECLIHTGQHYDARMSQSFFDELSIPEPDHNLGVGSGSHGQQTGEMLERLEPIIASSNFDALLVYGDTNSTLAGALVASKLPVPVAHVEAGLRSFNRRMPEEINRVLTDHVSDALFCPTDQAVENLTAEGVTHGVYRVGDVMRDALLGQLTRGVPTDRLMTSYRLQPKRYVLATIHRAENTDDPEKLQALMGALAALDEPVLLPLHPRTRGALQRFGIAPDGGQIRLAEPLSFSEMLAAEQAARVIVTDSGGVQKEAGWVGVPCVTVREETEWVETVTTGWNVLVGTDSARIVDAVRTAAPPAHADQTQPPSASATICGILEELFN
jgi:UDP-GlcNAc3NAcA epimerase